MLTPDRPAIAAGLGLFETMLVVHGRVVHLELHAARMAKSCLALGFAPLAESDFCDAANHAARGAGMGEAAVRVVRVAAEMEEWLLDATLFPIPAATRSRRENGRAITLDPSMTRSLPQHKLTSYAVCAIALRNAVASGADEALFVTSDSRILEGTSTNLFAVHGTTLVTAPVAAGVLPGIVRAWVVATASSIGLTIEENAPSSAEILGSLLHRQPHHPCADSYAGWQALPAAR